MCKYRRVKKKEMRDEKWGFALAKQFTQGLFDAGHGYQFDGQALHVEAFHIAFGHNHLSKTQIGGFADALTDARNRTNLAAQTHFAGLADDAAEEGVDIARKH